MQWLLLLWSRSSGSRAHELQELQCVGCVLVSRRLQSTSSVVVAQGLVVPWHVRSSLHFLFFNSGDFLRLSFTAQQFL